MPMRASARVGVGLVIMDSSMLVATMTGLPRLRQPCTMRACQNGTCARAPASARAPQLGKPHEKGANSPAAPQRTVNPPKSCTRVPHNGRRRLKSQILKSLIGCTRSSLEYTRCRRCLPLSCHGCAAAGGQGRARSGPRLLDRQFGAQVAARDHGAVHRVQDLVQVAHAVRALNLGQHADGRACGAAPAAHISAQGRGRRGPPQARHARTRRRVPAWPRCPRRAPGAHAAAACARSAPRRAPAAGGRRRAWRRGPSTHPASTWRQSPTLRILLWRQGARARAPCCASQCLSS